MSTDTREALAALMVIAAECAQRKPLRGFEELTEATHIGHHQFGRAHEQADEAVRMLAVRLRAVFDTLAAALATQPAQPSATVREWSRECDDADTILRALGLDPVNCRTDGGSLKTGMILDALQARDRMLQRSAPAAPSSCGLTECKNMPKCDRCKAWDSMGI